MVNDFSRWSARLFGENSFYFKEGGLMGKNFRALSDLPWQQ
jgi:hypothetical protein